MKTFRRLLSEVPGFRGLALASVTLFVVTGCTGFSGPGRLPAVPPPPEDSLVAAARQADTLGTLKVRFEALDSAGGGSDYGSGLYLLSLDNFLELAPDDPRAPEVSLWKANHLYNRGRFPDAVDQYARLLQRYPKSPQAGEAREMTARALVRSGAPEKAEDWYRRLLAETPAGGRAEAEEKVAQAVYLQAETAEREGKTDTAAFHYRRLVKAHPTASIAPTALFNAAVLMEKAEAVDTALSLYRAFFEAYYQSPLLPKALFREAKCLERKGDFAEAGRKYRNLVRAHGKSEEAEPSLYNAGIAFENAKLPREAAAAFEAYAEAYPDGAEAPNLLFRAAEMRAEAGDWEAVAALQNRFARLYAGSQGRLLQALCLEATAFVKQGKEAAARPVFARVVTEFRKMKSPSAADRLFAAQAQFGLASLEAGGLRDSPLPLSPSEEELRRKTEALKKTVEQFLRVFDFRALEWTLRASLEIGLAFEAYGLEVYRASSGLDIDSVLVPFLTGPRPGAAARGSFTALPAFPPSALGEAREAEAAVGLGASLDKALEQFRQILSLAEKQKISHPAVEKARRQARLALLRQAGAYARVVEGAVAEAGRREGQSLESRIGALQPALEVLPPAAALLERLRPQREAPWFGRGSASFQDSLHRVAFLPPARMGAALFALAAAAAAAAPAPELDPAQAFLHRRRALEEASAGLFDQGRELVETVLPAAPRPDSQRTPRSGPVSSAPAPALPPAALDSLPPPAWISVLYGHQVLERARRYDSLSREALAAPPFPAGISPEKKESLAAKYEEMGYALQDKALFLYGLLVRRAGAEPALLPFAGAAFARLYRLEPDRWSKREDGETLVPVLPWSGQKATAEELRRWEAGP